jgi:hypothetical protein
MAKSTTNPDSETTDNESTFTPTKAGTQSVATSTTYHPAQAKDLQRFITDLEGVLERARQSLVQNPPPYVPGPPVSTEVLHGAVALDFSNVYQTPHINAKVLGKVAMGGVLPLVADASKDEGYTWWKIESGEFKNGYVTGRGITMQ